MENKARQGELGTCERTRESTCRRHVLLLRTKLPLDVAAPRSERRSLAHAPPTTPSFGAVANSERAKCTKSTAALVVSKMSNLAALK